MPENLSDALVGTTVDHRYVIRSRIARGGMSTVYLATDLRLDRDVALKVLHPHLAHDQNFLDRLGREAKAAARLSHPHVVGMLDQGHDGGTAYLVMEYIEGHTLRDVITEKGGLSTRLALALASPVIEGLAAAHAAGLIHRDVKPENVLIAKDGRIKIGDFGLSRAVSTSTSTGALLGTVAYISPELVLGKPADARSDIYSAGIMLYEMLTGQQPFQGDVPIQVAYQHVNGTVPPPSALVPGLAPDVDELVQWCTANDPENRPVDGRALFEELSHIRTRLTDAELDAQPAAIQPAAAQSAATPGAPQASPLFPATDRVAPPAPSRPPGAESAQHTEVIQATSNPTTVFPASALGAPATSFLPRQYPTAQLDGTGEIDGAGGRAGSGAATQVPTPELGRDGGWPGPYAAPPRQDHPYAIQEHGGVAAPDRPLSKRAQQKAAREADKARSRAAATPVRNLREGNSRRRGVLWVIVLILVTALATGAGWFFGMGPGSPGIIPQLVNKTEDAAKLELTEAGFQYSTTRTFDDNVPAGHVVGTEPPSGTEIRRFERISLIVSRGPELFSLEELTGASLDEAKSTLNSTGMALGPVTEAFHESAPPGTVLAQDPAAGTDVRRGTPVALTVSKGPEPLPVPVVVGMEKKAAEEAIKAAGLKAEVVDEVNDASVPKGHVVAQTPANGTLTRDAKVGLTISKGPKMVKVPNFVGKQANVAQKELQDLGFSVRINEILGGLFGTVRAQEPADKELPEGSVITLTVV
ncbi:PASTA domain-containing protein [Pseudarthrobacter sp. J75]|uniref:Stk1 family PASTA domain-containing Ser/Thr kinase n=1 Tax=unclassified Pseudarthrobacter TaxID=2647000 RepID=UPI002E822FEF|nr:MULTISPECIES: PASTA domain-containing protein [unclassified Pseudarthrobacter]MEE2522779.1 PASTA domain-containing protein [Pseudarthrobacter sp. J47]MEE2529640.1 PASTA domain-containing protein [Pseudarthrobacter sp. J75]